MATKTKVQKKEPPRQYPPVPADTVRDANRYTYSENISSLIKTKNF